MPPDSSRHGWRRWATRLAQCTAASAITGLLWLGTSLCSAPLSGIDPGRGEAIFRARCESCHAATGAANLGYGPSLAEIGREAASRRPGQSAEEYLFDSIVRPAAFRPPQSSGVMPPRIAQGMGKAQVSNLVAFLMTQGGTLEPPRVVSAAARVHWNVLRPVAEAPLDLTLVEAGRALYLGRAQCAACHPLQRIPGYTLRGPSLLSVGLQDESFLRESLVQPSREIVPAYGEIQAETVTGHLISGRLLRHDSRGWELLTTSEPTTRIVRIPEESIARTDSGQPCVSAKTISTMPEPGELNPDDLRALLAFLRTLKY